MRNSQALYDLTYRLTGTIGLVKVYRKIFISLKSITTWQKMLMKAVQSRPIRKYP